MKNTVSKQIAYFSMEVGIRADLPTYSGGLGVLAGDTLKSAADLGLPVVGMTLLHRRGYFKQEIVSGKQAEAAVIWDPKDLLKKLPHTVTVEVESKAVKVQAWVYDIVGASGSTVPVVMLDTDCDGNDPYHRSISGQLYGGDERYRICQELILGVGGVRMLEEIRKHQSVSQAVTAFTSYHMNEGHAAFLTLELMRQTLGSRPLSSISKADIDAVKSLCVFTTHTPVAAGHDRFGAQLVEKTLGADLTKALRQLEVIDASECLNMTHLALKFSRFVNGVAKRHGEVSRAMFPGHEIVAITNGVHAATWMSDGFASLYDRYIPLWRRDQNFLRYACEIPLEDIRSAHRAAKASLIEKVQQLSGKTWKDDVFTIGFARRAATYKRADLLFNDIDRLKRLAAKYPGLQVCFSGKAHPKDEGGKALIARVIEGAEKLEASNISVVFLPNYDMNLGRLITTGVDLWLNNPVKPMEASGTSGMKSAMNGVPNLSTLDGWWVEGCVEGITGWEIEDEEDAMKLKSESGLLSKQAADALYRKLESTILPMYHERPLAFAEVMRHSIAINGSYFNTHRMVEQYAHLAW